MSMKKELTPEEIDSNWQKYVGFMSKLGDRSAAAEAMCEALGERLAICPASARREFHNAFPGGLVDHSLRVLGNAFRMAKAFDWSVSKDSLIVAALFHDIGKVGSPTHDFYVHQTDSWRVEKFGEEYTYNNDLPHMSTPDRSVYLCQHFGIKLSHDEWLAIKLNDGFSLDENKRYCLKVSPLVYTVMTADYISTMQEKQQHKEF